MVVGGASWLSVLAINEGMSVGDVVNNTGKEYSRTCIVGATTKVDPRARRR